MYVCEQLVRRCYVTARHAPSQWLPALHPLVRCFRLFLSHCVVSVSVLLKRSVISLFALLCRAVPAVFLHGDFVQRIQRTVDDKEFDCFV